MSKMQALCQELADNPKWTADDIGAPLPHDENAISVALPTWDSCIGYEEKDPAIINRLQAGYPRFVDHPQFKILHRFAQKYLKVPEDQELVLAPSEEAARLIAAYLAKEHGFQAAIHSLGAANIYYFLAPIGCEKSLRQCTQHAGQICSSRQCQSALSILQEGTPSQAAHQVECTELKSLLATWYAVESIDIRVHANGMASIANALRAVCSRRPHTATLQMGFPYVDLLKIQETFGEHVHFIPRYDEAAHQAVEALLKTERLCAVFIEVPGNPLLKSPDVPRISAACRQAGVPLVIDDTVASVLNVSLLEYADIIVSSLTKYVAGNARVMGGSAVVSPQSPWYRELVDALTQNDDNACWADDLSLLTECAAGYPERIRTMNTNALQLVQLMREHPAVDQVLFPDRCPHFKKIQRQNMGFGSLFSIVLNEPSRHTKQVYDALTINKGPSLGTEFSLCCPFTILAHYEELDWAESLEVSRWLLRFAIGCEPVDQIWNRIKPALDLAVL